MLDWKGCSAKYCPYDKEYADCTFCQFLIREEPYEYKSDIWSRSCVRPYSEEEYDRIMEAKIISKAINMMRKCSHSDLTAEQAKTIIDILEDK